MDLQINSFFPSSSSSFSRSWSYDVFLSFRGSDTRYNFTGNLYKSLNDKGIRTFIDDRELKGGEEITLSLVEAIQESRIAIVVFSKNYAFSSFCLDELATIMEFVKGDDRLVYPIFYDVDPSVVRYQNESYGEAIAKYKERFNDGKIHKWREALRQVADLSGKHVKIGDVYEHDYVKNITEVILNKIHHAPLHVTEYPVGLKSRVQEVCHLLNIKSHSEVIMMGIHGIGGIGKTTLAKAVYNSIALQFEGCCFLEKVSEKMKKHGLEHLQQVVISKLLEIKDNKVESVSEGIPVLQRLSQKKVLLILDDVDEHEQLRAIAGSVNWFGSGSRVIVTTRNMHLLNIHGIERHYKVHGLSEDEAHQLLSWKAFKCENIDPSFKDISKQAVTYARGLPLALEVIGSNFFGKCIQEWKFTLDRYKKIPHEDIQKILKISFDSLKEFQKKLFLDIACCFNGYVWSEVMYKLHACYESYGVPLEYDINMLVQKSLLKNDGGWMVTVHDLIRDMAREIVREESPEHPGKRSRLWFPRDIVQVLEEDSGSDEIEIITLYAPQHEKVTVEWDGNAFKKMENLKVLIISNACFSQAAKYLPNRLRVLEWLNHPSNLLPCVCIPNERKFTRLKVLKFDYSDILEIPDISSVPNLETLSFEGCKNLIQIHESVGFLKKLFNLNVLGCSSLKTFPALKLPCLEGLMLSGCPSLEIFPEILCNMEKFTYLFIEGTLIKELPSSSLTKLKTLEELEVCDVHGGLQCLKQDAECQGSSRVSLKAPQVTFRHCNMLDESVAMVLALFRNVISLDLSGSSFTFLPESIKELCSLRKLNLDNCKKLEEIRGIPPNIITLSAINCMSLSPSSRSMLLDKELHSSGEKMFFLPGNSIPKWFKHRKASSSLHLWFRNKLPPVSLCVPGHIKVNVFINRRDRYRYYWFTDDNVDWFGHGDDKVSIAIHDREISLENEDGFLSKDKWNHVVFGFDGPNKFGIHIHKNENTMEDIRFTDPLQQTSRFTKGSSSNVDPNLDSIICSDEEIQEDELSSSEDELESNLMLLTVTCETIRDQEIWNTTNAIRFSTKSTKKFIRETSSPSLRRHHSKRRRHLKSRLPVVHLRRPIIAVNHRRLTTTRVIALSLFLIFFIFY